MSWTVTVKKKVRKNAQKLPPEIRKILVTLLAEIEAYGPYRNNWQNYGPLGGNRYHCHLKRGKPTYVAVWEIKDKAVRLVEISYVGTHERAPY
ncbi:MAG: cytotoxic translational repressor of toxin-antitoxin stability system [Desulfobacteraceae bacterium 4572_87]|nr:MAG: cytotoxic translational repressor of toxin-antitoxin stability system [Desulfobacteraceae bacterium 4572_87]